MMLFHDDDAKPPARQVAGLLYYHLCSSTAADFLSESAETQAALVAVGEAFWVAWAPGVHVVVQVRERDRLVPPAADLPACHLRECAAQLRPLAQVETEPVVCKVRQPRKKLHAVSAVVAACPLILRYQHAVWMAAPGA